LVGTTLRTIKLYSSARGAPSISVARVINEHHAAVGHRAGAVGIHLIMALIGALDEPPGTYRLALRVRDVRLREAAGAVIGQDAESGYRRLADFRLCSS